MIVKQSRRGMKLDMARVEERLQRLSEEGDEPQQMCERWSKRSAFWERWCEFAVVVSRLNQLEAEAPTGNGEESTEEINELWRKRAELATQIVDAAVATVEEAIFKVTVTASLLSEGEIRVVLTPQCLGDCDRALAVDGDGKQCVKTLEPDLWTACLRVREQIAEADEDAETLGLTWWRDLQNLVGEIAGYEAMTRAGLRAKGQVFQDLFDFASLMDGLSALQMSYVRDFGNLAYRRLRDEDSLLTRRAVCSNSCSRRLPLASSPDDMECAGCQDFFVRDERWFRRAFCLRDRRRRRGGPRRGVGRDSERKADTGTVAPLALAPPVDSTPSRCLNTLPRPARSF
jgi:hypothetical protein